MRKLRRKQGEKRGRQFTTKKTCSRTFLPGPCYLTSHKKVVYIYRLARVIFLINTRNARPECRRVYNTEGGQ